MIIFRSTVLEEQSKGEEYLAYILAVPACCLDEAALQGARLKRVVSTSIAQAREIPTGPARPYQSLLNESMS